MGKKNKSKINPASPNKPASSAKIKSPQGSSYLPWLIISCVITAICLYPMLQNGFTNWDDEFYVIKNALLRGPDLAGIFSEPVVGNYHPLTIASLAFNYKMTGLEASSYLLFNYVLHLVNTGLVFYFIWRISDKNARVAFFSALIFGIHPMHVESVAWISERKDVLYTFFFLLSLLQYWHYLQTEKKGALGFSFLFFILSLLSKPAAIILPLVLLLLDYWKGRHLVRKTWMEKIPFFLLSIFFAVLTLKVQSSSSAVVDLNTYPLWSRPLFACYVFMIYLLRFLIPYPLSTFHPFPDPNHLGWSLMVSPLFILALAALVFYYRRNRVLVFGILFFVVNLLLVAQIVSIGSSLVSERYTYVPYIGLAFLSGMLIDRIRTLSPRTVFVFLSVFVIIVFGYITFRQTGVWKNSETLWTNVINYYPTAPIPRTNRANYYITKAVDPANKEVPAVTLYENALEDCNAALDSKPDDEEGLANRQNVYLNLNRDSLALVDANALLKVNPKNKTGYYTRSLVFTHLGQHDQALAAINSYLSLDSLQDYAFSQRAFLYFNPPYQKFDLALEDYSRAIQLNPLGAHYLNRSYCYMMKGDTLNAKADALNAIAKGASLSEEYRRLLKL